MAVAQNLIISNIILWPIKDSLTYAQIDVIHDTMSQLACDWTVTNPLGFERKNSIKNDSQTSTAKFLKLL